MEYKEPDMEIRQLQYFVTLAQEGNYLNAAETLYVSQSQLSKKIMALEEELAVKLIDRSKRKIAVTDEGNIVLEHAQDILVFHEAMLRELGEFKGLAPPVLDILSIPVLAPYEIPALLSAFRKEEPEIRIQVTEAEASVILPALGRKEAELGLVRDIFIDQELYGFAPVCEDEVVAIIPRNHRLAGRTSIELADLKGEPFIMSDKQTLLYNFYLELCRRKGIEPNIVHTSSHTENIVEMVASGMGVSLMMRTVVAYQKKIGVCVMPLSESVTCHLGFAWSKDTRLSKSARKFISFIRKTCPRPACCMNGGSPVSPGVPPLSSLP